MGSFIQIDSISIDLANSIDKKSTTDTGKCEHFSIRGYVSEIRKKDWKMCWPFPLKESYSESENPASLLPPLDVPKFRWWCCRNCQEEVAPESTEKDDQTTGCKSDRNCSNEALPSNIQQDPILSSTVKRREIDLNNSVDDLSCGNYSEPIKNEKRNKAEVARSRIIDHEIELKDDVNHQTASVPPKVYPGLRQETSVNETGCENNEVAVAMLPTSNLKACTVSRESTTVSEAGDITNQTTGDPPLDLAVCHHNVAETTENLIENDIQDHQLIQLDKSTGLPRRKHRKVRLMADLLRDNGEARTEQMITQGSPSNHSTSLQTVSIPQDKVNVPGDLINVGQSRKRKFLLDDQDPKPTEMCSQEVDNGVEKFEGDAGTNTLLNTWSKDVLAEMDLKDDVNSYVVSPEIERSHNMGKRKGKKSQFVDDYLISESHQKQHKESNKIIDGVDKLHSSKNCDSGLFTEKRMDDSPQQVPMTENECNLRKGKGKMSLTRGDLASLSSLKNNVLAGEKVIWNMPAAVPIHSAQCALNENGLEEGLHLSLNSNLASQVYNKKMIHQTENQLPFSLPFQEGTSKSKVHRFLREDRGTNFVGELSIHSNHRTDAISGKEVCSEEIAVGRNTEKTAEGLKQAGTVKKHGDQIADNASDQVTVDDIPMEIVELMAKNQYERCLPDAENGNHLLEESTVRRKAQITVSASIYGKGEFTLLQEGQKEKPQGRSGKNGMVTAENVRPSKRKSAHHVSAFDGNCSDMYALHPPPSSSGIEVSKSQKKTSRGVHFSPMHSSLLAGAQNKKLNGNGERGSSNSSVRSQGGCSLHTTILQEDDEASRIWASLTPKHAPLVSDMSTKVASQYTTGNNDVTTVRSGVLLKHNLKRDIDLNYSNLDAADVEKLNRDIGLGVFSKVHSENPFPCKNNGIESHKNLKGSLDLYANDTIPAMHLLSLMDAGMQSGIPLKQGVSEQLLKRPYLDDCNTKLEIGKWPSTDYCRKNYLPDKSHGCFLGTPTFGASTSSVQHDGNFLRAAGGQISSKFAKKEKMKSSNSHELNRCKSPKSVHSRGELVKDSNALPVYNAQKRFPSVSDGKQFSWPRLETETTRQRKLEVRGNCGTFLPMKNSSGPIQCSTNKNPADLPLPEAEFYMIRGEDLKFEKASIPQVRPGLLGSHGRKQQRNLKRTKIKDHAKHSGGILHAK